MNTNRNLHVIYRMVEHASFQMTLSNCNTAFMVTVFFNIRSPMPSFTFTGAQMWEYNLQDHQNLEFCPQTWPPGLTR